ncbi:distal membrane-arm assembly complex protein 2 isoform X2 [Anguilla anguilla]|uniref:distal membrane-arm assembly complex protein 2 isoform X2 n=1 Tax=Anguilla anguilla TaxID=7936 RepID=UPI0015A85E4B|nr:distal membrane-arm assembly complex protein 2 isoform X2 [Anguilla anguilla]
MALLMLMKSRGCVRSCVTITSRNLSSAPAPLAPPKLNSKLALFLYQRFHDVEQMVSWSSWLKRWTLRRKNVYYGYTQMHYGDNVAAAYYILCMKGRFRFAGQSDWFQANYRGKFSWDFMNFRDVPIEEVDMSGTLINYSGLDNLESQQGLRSLSLRGCPEVDDWFLSHLHIFQDSLEELDLSHCSQITVGGLASLHHLRKLRRLGLSSLPRLQSPGLVRILLEEVLPHCHISGVEYSQGLDETGTDTGLQTETEINQLTEDHTYTQGPHRQTLTR